MVLYVNFQAMDVKSGKISLIHFNQEKGTLLQGTLSYLGEA
jgi:hypothetical protein